MGTKSFLNVDLLTTLCINQITYLSQASKVHEPNINPDWWISSTEMGLRGALTTEWSSYIKDPCGEGITLLAFKKR
jgi:hypothetical protein